MFNAMSYQPLEPILLLFAELDLGLGLAIEG
jgi:hypothetical protein